MTLVHAKSLFHSLLNIAGHQKSVIASTGQKKKKQSNIFTADKKNINNLPKFPFYTAGKQNRFPLSSPHTSAGVQAMPPTLSWHHCRCAILLNGYSVTIIPLCIEVCERTVRGWGVIPILLACISQGIVPSCPRPSAQLFFTPMHVMVTSQQNTSFQSWNP